MKRLSVSESNWCIGSVCSWYSRKMYQGTDWSSFTGGTHDEHTMSMQHQAVSSILVSREKVTFQEALLTPAVLSCSASASSAPTNVFWHVSLERLALAEDAGDFDVDSWDDLFHLAEETGDVVFSVEVN